MRHTLSSILIAGLMAVAGQAAADFEKITSKSEFDSLITRNQLGRTGIELTVTPAGQIEGSAFGQPVSGKWSWEGEYFCRDLAWGDTDFGYNCQEVARDGNALRFTSDRGAGRSAKLYLK